MEIKDLFIKEIPDPDDRPFLNIVADDILNPEILFLLSQSFPDQSNTGWEGDTSYKLTMGSDEKKWPSIGKDFFNLLKSDQFCSILSNKFNTPKLIGITLGGGYHISLKDTMLPLHNDWQKLNKIYRYVNLHIYLNKNYHKSDGGELVLSKDSDIKSIEPKDGRLVIYSSHYGCVHGHPSKWTSNVPRRALTVYYFSEEPHQSTIELINRSNFYKKNI